MKPFFERRPSWMMWVTPVSRGFSRSPHKARGRRWKKGRKGPLRDLFGMGKAGYEGPCLLSSLGLLCSSLFLLPFFLYRQKKKGSTLGSGEGGEGGIGLRGERRNQIRWAGEREREEGYTPKRGGATRYPFPFPHMLSARYHIHPRIGG